MSQLTLTYIVTTHINLYCHKPLTGPKKDVKTLMKKSGICIFTFLQCDFRENVIPKKYINKTLKVKLTYVNFSFLCLSNVSINKRTL